MTEQDQRLAKNIYAALMADRLGVAFATARKHVDEQLGEREIGPLWIAVAESLRAMLVKSVENLFGDKVRPIR
jgi:hypothetical protein